MTEELARSVPTDAAYGGRGRHLAAFPFALPLLAVPLSVIASRGLVPFAVVLALIGLVAQLGGHRSVQYRVDPLLPFAAALAWGTTPRRLGPRPAPPNTTLRGLRLTWGIPKGAKL